MILVKRCLHSMKIVGIAMLLSSLFINSCGKNGEQFLQSVTLQQIDDPTTGDVFAKFITVFNLGNLEVPYYLFPVKKDGVLYGEIEIKPTLNLGQAEVTFSANVTRLANLGGGLARLPNGKELPIGDLSSVKVLEIAVSASGSSKVYFTLDAQSPLIGFAISVNDILYNITKGKDLFYPFKIGSVRTIGGVYVGQSAGQSGVAFFANLRGLFGPEALAAAKAGHVFNADLLAEHPRLIVPLAAPEVRSWEAKSLDEKKFRAGMKSLYMDFASQNKKLNVVP